MGSPVPLWVPRYRCHYPGASPAALSPPPARSQLCCRVWVPGMGFGVMGSLFPVREHFVSELEVLRPPELSVPPQSCSPLSPGDLRALRVQELGGHVAHVGGPGAALLSLRMQVGLGMHLRYPRGSLPLPTHLDTSEFWSDQVKHHHAQLPMPAGRLSCALPAPPAPPARAEPARGEAPSVPQGLPSLAQQVPARSCSPRVPSGMLLPRGGVWD